MRALLVSVFLFIISGWVSAQETNAIVKGIVNEKTEKGLLPLYGAHVKLVGASQGAITDESGRFSIGLPDAKGLLVVSYAGYSPDTISVVAGSVVSVNLEQSVALNEVEIKSRVRTTNIGYMETLKIEKIGEGELHKAACCNLSESFETNPSVDVSFTDAVTGTKQIQMLGLAGPYTQISRENMPDIRGLSAILGLTYTPGAWVESIALIKGAGSVVNGFESIAGQIDVSLRNPNTMDRFFVNLYASQEARFEGNVNMKFAVSPKWKTALLLHGKTNQLKIDMNHDGFMDMPIGDNVLVLNRWEYEIENGHIELGVKAGYLDQEAGQIHLHENGTQNNHGLWKMLNFTHRLELWTKTGKVMEANPEQSFGLQLSGIYHDQNSQFGHSNYSGVQKSFYGNFIFQGNLWSSENKFKMGASFIYDDYMELFKKLDYSHMEYVPGVFFEYSRSIGEWFNVVAGLRGDYSNHYGFFATPRLHLGYLPHEHLAIRASAGRGQRTAQVILENIGLLASNRVWLIDAQSMSKPYGLDAEVAWNFGINLTYEFELDYREGVVSFDFYRTNFENQIVVDLDSDVREVRFYNLSGESFSNSLQAQIDYELFKRFDVRLAYRWYDVKTTYGEELMSKPFLASHRAFINLAYATRNYWKFDATLNWQGAKRLPSTLENPAEYLRMDKSPDFFLMNIQISKTIRERLEIYLGIENLLDYTQKNPIIAADEPFSEYFDASMIWGPVYGRNTYLGIRYRLK